MNGRDRILTALERGTPDTVPVWELAFNESSIINIASHFVDSDRLPPNRLLVDLDEMEMVLLLEAYKTIVRELDIDGVFTTTAIPLERIDDAHVRDANGVVYHCSDHGEPYPVDGPVKSLDDLKDFRIRPPQDEDFFLINYARSQFPDKAVSYMLSGPFYLSWSLRGSMGNLLMDYISDPEMASELIRMVTDHCLSSLEKIAAAGADFVVLECDLAFKTGTIMSLRHYEKFVGKYHREIVAEAHRLGLKVVKHSDGVLDDFLPSFADEGFDAIHPIQPQCMDIGSIKRKYGGRFCIMGNIDCSELLPFGTQEEVRKSVRDTIGIAAPGGGYILSSSNTIHPGVKAENYIEMVKAARAFGSYA